MMQQPIEPPHRDFLRDIEAGKDIHEALVQRHRKNTDKLKIQEMKEKLFADETPQERQSSAGIRKADVMRGIKLIKEEEERKRKEELALEAIDVSDMLTEIMPSFMLPVLEKPMLKLPLEQVSQLVEEAPNLHSQKIQAVQEMQFDEHDRPYLAVANPYDDTVELADKLIFKYRCLRDSEYPVVVLLSSLRYLTRTDDYFISGNKRIKYIHDVSMGILFDVAVRGENWVI